MIVVFKTFPLLETGWEWLADGDNVYSGNKKEASSLYLALSQKCYILA